VTFTSVVFLSSTVKEGLLTGHAINIPQRGTESEVSAVRNSLSQADSHVLRVEGSYCSMPPRQDACNVVNNCLVECEIFMDINLPVAL
jgi:hypothetical protein